MKYLLRFDILEPGDIILKRSDTRESKLIRERSGSNYSHALIYVGHMSCLESGGLGVRSRNVQCILFDSLDAASLFRLNESVLEDRSNREVIERAIQYARSLVGMEYDTEEARRASTNNSDTAQRPNRQFCTRYIAKSFEHGGVSLAPNPDYCSPSDIETSQNLAEVNDCLRPADDAEVEKGKEENHPLSLQTGVWGGFLQQVRERYNTDVQTMTQLVDFVVSNPEVDPEVANLLEESGFLDLWKIDREKHPYYYNYKAFKDEISDEIKDGLASFLRREAISSRENRYRPTFMSLTYAWNNTDLLTLEYLVQLYSTLLEQTRRREEVADQHFQSD